jgi:nucleotide-binding universal stress UspA family protein
MSNATHRDGPLGGFRLSILVPTDLTDRTVRALDVAQSFAGPDGARITPWRTKTGFMARSMLDALVRRTKRRTLMTEAIARILVPVDFSAHSDRALRYATALANQLGAAVELLHVVKTRTSRRGGAPRSTCRTFLNSCTT